MEVAAVARDCNAIVMVVSYVARERLVVTVPYLIMDSKVDMPALVPGLRQKNATEEVQMLLKLFAVHVEKHMLSTVWIQSEHFPASSNPWFPCRLERHLPALSLPSIRF
jgi:hypothetical protein